MTVQAYGPLPRALVEAALTKPHPDGRRSRGWMRRRGLRPVSIPEQTRGTATGSEVGSEVGIETLAIDSLSVDTGADFVQCQHPGCCALRPLEGDDECAVCGRR